MNVSLVLVNADGKTKELPAFKLPVTIGRSEQCRLRIPVASVSRQHCELLEHDDELTIRDLRSSNGTFVNKDRVTQRELVPGDLISVGPVVFVVRIDGHPRIVDPVISWANGAVTPEEGAGGGAADGGVPTWSASSGPRPSDAPTLDHRPLQAKPAGSPARPANAEKPPPKPAKGKDDTDGFESLLADLSESDFDDIDLGDEGSAKAAKK